LYNEEFYNLCSVLNVIGVIRSKRMRWMRRVTCMEERRNLYKVLVGKRE
jgi:hypothetical protein